MDTLDVELRLTNLHCFEEGDSAGSAEPYLWTVFFKIDGDTTVVNDKNALQGTATVVGTPGNHGNLPNHDVDPGENILIPAAIGVFNTRLRPIPLVVPIGDVTEVGGAVGVITVLMEQDNTSNSDVAQGHRRARSSCARRIERVDPDAERRESRGLRGADRGDEGADRWRGGSRDRGAA